MPIRLSGKEIVKALAKAAGKSSGSAAAITLCGTLTATTSASRFTATARCRPERSPPSAVLLASPPRNCASCSEAEAPGRLAQAQRSQLRNSD